MIHISLTGSNFLNQCVLGFYHPLYTRQVYEESNIQYLNETNFAHIYIGMI